MEDERDIRKTEYDKASDVNSQANRFAGHRADPSRYAQYEDDADFDDPLADDTDVNYDDPLRDDVFGAKNSSGADRADAGMSTSADTVKSSGADTRKTSDKDAGKTGDTDARKSGRRVSSGSNSTASETGFEDAFADNAGEINDPLAEEMGTDLTDTADKKSEKSKKKGRLSKNGSDDDSKGRKKGLFSFGRKVGGFKVVRVEDIKKSDYNYNQEDMHDVLSTYIPVRRAKLIGRALLRMDKMRLFLLGALLLIALLFFLAFMQEKMGNFTINLDRLELFRKGIAMSADPEFTTPTARLTASHVEDATNISIDDLPSDIADVDGDHNGRNYMAYTYYVRNAGKEDVDYLARLTIDANSKGAEEAVRVAVWKDGERTVYAWPSKTGEPEKGCVNFESEKVVCSFEEDDFKVGYVNKYTVVIWMEGDDPECVDKIIGGSVEFSMNIAAADNNNTSLISKYIQDIKDSLSGDKSIGAAGTEAPDYFKYQDVNWYTRRNRPGYEEETESSSQKSQ